MLQVVVNFLFIKFSMSFLSVIKNNRNVMSISYVLLIAFFAMYPVLPPLFKQWLSHADYDYCVIVALLGMGMLAYRIHLIKRVNVQPNLSLCVLLGFVCLLQCVLWMGRSEIGAQLLIPPILWLSLASICGYKISKELIAPIIFLYFAIPLWDQLLPILQKIAILGSEYGMKIIGVPVVVTDNRLTIPEGTFEVLYSCSGLRYLVAGMALTFFIAMVDRVEKRKFLYLLLITICLAIVFNWIRIITVIYAGHLTGMRHYFVSNNHKWLGEGLFGCLLLIVFIIEGRFRKQSLITKKIDQNVDNAKDEKKADIFDKLPMYSQNQLLPLLIVTVNFLIFNIFFISMREAESVTDDLKLGAVPVMSGDWQGPLKSSGEWRPKFLGAADERYFRYITEGRSVHVYMNIYRHQLQGKELVFDGNTITDPVGWQNVGYSLINHLKSVMGSVPYGQIYRDGQGRYWVVGHIYSVGGLTTPSAFATQILYGLSALLEEKPSGIIAFAISCDDECDVALRMAGDFWATMGDPLLGALPSSM